MKPHVLPGCVTPKTVDLIHIVYLEGHSELFTKLQCSSVQNSNVVDVPYPP